MPQPKTRSPFEKPDDDGPPEEPGSTAVAWEDAVIETGVESPEQLLAHPRNPRIHTAFLQNAVKDSLDRFGWVRHVLVNRTTGHVIDGHGRIKVAMREGVAQVPVDYIEKTEAEEDAILATLDEMVKLAGTDASAQKKLLDGLREQYGNALGTLIGNMKTNAEAKIASEIEDVSDDSEPGDHKTPTAPDGDRLYGGATSIARGSGPMKLWRELGLLDGDVLDFGCGKDDHAFAKYDPFTQPNVEPLLRDWEVIVCNYVLQVQPADHLMRQILALVRTLLRPGGRAAFAVRSDMKPGKHQSARGVQQIKTKAEWRAIVGEFFEIEAEPDGSGFFAYVCSAKKVE